MRPRPQNNGPAMLTACSCKTDPDPRKPWMPKLTKNPSCPTHGLGRSRIQDRLLPSNISKVMGEARPVEVSTPEQPVEEIRSRPPAPTPKIVPGQRDFEVRAGQQRLAPGMKLESVGQAFDKIQFLAGELMKIASSLPQQQRPRVSGLAQDILVLVNHAKTLNKVEPA